MLAIEVVGCKWPLLSLACCLALGVAASSCAGLSDHWLFHEMRLGPLSHSGLRSPHEPNVLSWSVIPAFFIYIMGSTGRGFQSGERDVDVV